MYFLTQIYQYNNGWWSVSCCECRRGSNHVSTDLTTATAGLTDHRRAAPDDHPISLHLHDREPRDRVPTDGEIDLSGDVGDSWFRAPRSVAGDVGGDGRAGSADGAGAS